MYLHTVLLYSLLLLFSITLEQFSRPEYFGLLIYVWRSSVNYIQGFFPNYISKLLFLLPKKNSTIWLKTTQSSYLRESILAIYQHTLYLKLIFLSINSEKIKKNKILPQCVLSHYFILFIFTYFVWSIFSSFCLFKKQKQSIGLTGMLDRL